MPAPPAPAPVQSSPIGKIPRSVAPHKRDQVQAFDENVQQSQLINSIQFLEYLRVGDNVLPSKTPDSLLGLSMDGFCSLANHIARSIKEKHFPNSDLLVFKDTENKTPSGHVTGTKCRPDITAAFENDWRTDGCTDWALIRLAGERASKGKSLETQKKNAATYLHYLLLARPDFFVAQGLLTTTSSLMFFVGIGGVGIQRLDVDWKNEDLYKLIYALIYRLYDPSHFSDSSYERTEFDAEAFQATYTVRAKEKAYSGFRSIHARNPFATRTHVLSDPSFAQKNGVSVIKEQLCRTERRFTEWTILDKIHKPMTVPGVVEAVWGETIEDTLCPGRDKYRLGLRQTGLPFTSIPTAKQMLETLFDLLEVLRFLRFKRQILHRDVSVGNVMYINKPEIPAKAVEPLVFAKYLLEESKFPHETSLLLVDFNVGEDLEDGSNRLRIERTGTPIFISRAVEHGNPVPLAARFVDVPRVPKSPECYANAHVDRIKQFPPETDETVVDSRNLKNQSQDYVWRHELDHDVESVFWLLLHWAMVMQPEKGPPGRRIHTVSWASLLGDHKDRQRLVSALSSGDAPVDLTHSVYKPLWPLITNLAAILGVDRHWLPESDVRKSPEYICEAFQRLILQFIDSNRNEHFMTCPVGDALRQVEPVAQSQTLTSPSQLRDGSEREGSERESKRLCLGKTKDENDNKSSLMQAE